MMNMSGKMDLKIEIKSFDQLNNRELYSICALRQEVFVVEQECAYLDADGLDEFALHLFTKDKNELLAYSRILPPGRYYESYSAIGRVVVKKDQRKSGLGRLIMKESVKVAFSKYPDEAIKISAQCYLTSFYESLDFKTSGESYLEDGIPHIAMIKLKNP